LNLTLNFLFPPPYHVPHKLANNSIIRKKAEEDFAPSAFYVYVQDE